MVSGLLEGFLSKSWQWFVEKVWPAIREYFTDFILKILDKVFSELKQIVEDSLDNKAGRASDKARFAEDKAAEANDVETILRYKEEARIWKDVALEYASSKNELDHKFVEHKNKTKSNVVDDISKIGLRSDFQGGDTKVKIGTVDDD